MSNGIQFLIILPSYYEADNLPPLLERYAQVWTQSILCWLPRA